MGTAERPAPDACRPLQYAYVPELWGRYVISTGAVTHVPLEIFAQVQAIWHLWQ